jgi:NAD-reducing hydrogenase small subunit
LSKPTVATIWLDGCPGCHMSFLDLDERLIELSAHFDLVYSPLVGLKVLPTHVDIALVEGSVSNEDDEHKIKLVRSRVPVHRRAVALWSLEKDHGKNHHN